MRKTRDAGMRVRQPASRLRIHLDYQRQAVLWQRCEHNGDEGRPATKVWRHNMQKASVLVMSKPATCGIQGTHSDAREAPADGVHALRRRDQTEQVQLFLGAPSCLHTTNRTRSCTSKATGLHTSDDDGGGTRSAEIASFQAASIRRDYKLSSNACSSGIRIVVSNTGGNASVAILAANGLSSSSNDEGCRDVHNQICMHTIHHQMLSRAGCLMCTSVQKRRLSFRYRGATHQQRLNGAHDGVAGRQNRVHQQHVAGRDVVGQLAVDERLLLADAHARVREVRLRVVDRLRLRGAAHRWDPTCIILRRNRASEAPSSVSSSTRPDSPSTPAFPHSGNTRRTTLGDAA